MSDTRKCPYCGGEIKSIAKKCKHCGKWLVTNEGSQKDENQTCPPSLVSEPQIRRIKPISTQQSKDEDNKSRAKGSSKKTILYIVIGVISLFCIIALSKFIPKGESRKVSDFENGVVLDDKGDSIAAAIASTDYIEEGTALSKYGREERAKELMNDRYSKELSNQARALITKERFNEVYVEYFANYDWLKMGDPELRFKSVWSFIPQKQTEVKDNNAGQIENVANVQPANIEHSELMSLSSFVSLSKKTPKEVMDLLKKKGYKVEPGGPFYTCNVSNSENITIYMQEMPRMGTGSVEFSTTSKSQYNEWKRQLKNDNYRQVDEDTWTGINEIRLVNLLDAPEEDDYCSTATLCLKR